MYFIETIAEVVKGNFVQKAENNPIAYLSFDSRNIAFAPHTLFFALHTPRHDGHSYLGNAYQQGVRHFIVDKEIDGSELRGANIIWVQDTLCALQELASFHRQQFSVPVIGITGSNGKTIVKEWLNLLLQDDYKIARSPKSYNSQIGVPLSVWQLNNEHTLGLFEAGISQKGEMQRLATVIQPTIGVLTNIGEAHSEGFASEREKLEEKLILFNRAAGVICEDKLASRLPAGCEPFTWGNTNEAILKVNKIAAHNESTEVQVTYKNHQESILIPFTDEASIQNALACCCVLLYLGYRVNQINKRLSRLHAVDMRLQLKHGNNGCTIINDSYSTDLTSLSIALHFLVQQPGGQRRTVVLSDFMESGKKDRDLYQTVVKELLQNKIEKVIAIGSHITQVLPAELPAGIHYEGYDSTKDFLERATISAFQKEIILVKGARRFGFERIVQWLETKVHQTVLEINLNALVSNLKQYQALLQPATKVMAMVKAFSYGSGSAEVASVLQYHHTDYLGVAYTDEGAELRRAGIHLPIMVLNTDESSFAAITEFNLQPVLYSFSLVHQFRSFLEREGITHYPVHIEVETGMNRLGFSLSEMQTLGETIKASAQLKVESIFSHLAASEDSGEDNFTESQAELFSAAAGILSSCVPYPFLKHLSNSAAIIRHPSLQYDMVRLGIGLYGIEIETDKLNLQPVASLKSTIAQLKKVKRGETVSYNRRGVIKQDSVIATVRIGYADGYSRRFSNGRGKMWVKGKLAPVIGAVCMDMTMIDVTGIPGVEEGDEVVVFGKELPVQQLASWGETIPYEILTGVSQRVKRVYFKE